MRNNEFPAADNPKDLPEDPPHYPAVSRAPSLGEVGEVPDNSNMNYAKPTTPPGGR
jgi:hypothetical protein